MATTAIHLGITDDVTDCECCGKTGLRSTVALALVEEGDTASADDVLHYGSSCAARAIARHTGTATRTRDVITAARTATRTRRNAIEAATRTLGRYDDANDDDQVRAYFTNNNLDRAHGFIGPVFAQIRAELADLIADARATLDLYGTPAPAPARNALADATTPDEVAAALASMGIEVIGHDRITVA